MTRAWQVLAVAAVAGHAVTLARLNRKLDAQHDARMAQATRTHQVVTAAIRDQDDRARRLLDDVKAAPARRRRSA